MQYFHKTGTCNILYLAVCLFALQDGFQKGRTDFHGVFTDTYVLCVIYDGKTIDRLISNPVKVWYHTDTAVI